LQGGYFQKHRGLYAIAGMFCFIAEVFCFFTKAQGILAGEQFDPKHQKPDM